MPELPEVEVVKKSLKKTIYQLTLKHIDIRNKFLRYKIDHNTLKKLINSKVLSISRRSKYILIKFDNGNTILIHLGMTGKIIMINSSNVKHKSSFYFKIKENDPKHDHVIFRFHNNIKFIYNDVRKFGFIKVEKSNRISFNKHLSILGPEPLSQYFNVSYFKEKVKKRKIFLKDLLMDQKFVSGLGNIYVNEVLFSACLKPQKKANKLSEKNIKNLVFYIKKILKKAIKEGGSSIKDFNNAEGMEGNFQQFFNVYGKKGEKCSRQKCVGKIKSVKISNRSSFFCPICQK